MPLFVPNAPDIPEIKTYADVAALDAVVVPEVGRLTVPNMSAAFPTLPGNVASNGASSILVSTSVQDSTTSSPYSFITQLFPITGSDMEPGFALRTGYVLDSGGTVTWGSWRRSTISNKMWHWDAGNTGGTTVTIDPATLDDNRIIVMYGGILSLSPKRQVYVRDPFYVYNRGPGTVQITGQNVPSGFIPPNTFARVDQALGQLGPGIENEITWVTILGNPSSWKPGPEIYYDRELDASAAGTVPYMNRDFQTITLPDLSPLSVLPAPIHLWIGNAAPWTPREVAFTSPVTINGPKRLRSQHNAARFIEITWRSGQWYVMDPYTQQTGPVDAWRYADSEWWGGPLNLNDTMNLTLEPELLSPVPIFLSAGAYDAARIKINTAGPSGNLIRLGLYDQDVLVKDFGTVSGSSTGTAISSASTLVVPYSKWHLAVAVSQGVTTSNPQILAARAIGDAMPVNTDLDYPSSTQVRFNGAESGVLPASISAKTRTAAMGQGMPLITLRRSYS